MCSACCLLQVRELGGAREWALCVVLCRFDLCALLCGQRKDEGEDEDEEESSLRISSWHRGDAALLQHI
jgi:hypothetical protein